MSAPLDIQVPQANRLPVVRHVVEAVAAGHVDWNEVSDALILERRHVLYYVQAARVLGWLSAEEPPAVTPAGKALLDTPPQSPAEAATMEVAARGAQVVKLAAPDLFEFASPSRAELAKRLVRLVGLSMSTAERRAQTLVAWRNYILSGKMSLFQGAEMRTTLRPESSVSGQDKIGSDKAARHSEVRFLTSLRLVDFKNFVDATVPLGPLTLITGTNASGKSNIREAFRFLHGVSRGYGLAEIIGEKWVEGGVLQWRGLRGGTREVTFRGRDAFALETMFEVSDRGKPRQAMYRIEVEVGTRGVAAPKIRKERLVIEGRGQFVFDSHPETNPPTQDDPYHLSVRLRKEGQRGWTGPTVKLFNTKPALSQLVDHPEVKFPSVREHVRLALTAFQSMRFLDLSPESMRLPSLPGQTILGDRGENLSSVLLAVCQDPHRKKALLEWVRELTPLDAKDFEFVPDQTGRVLLTLVEDGGQKTSAFSASDGTLRFLAMVAALLGPEQARFYFFEELENGIHPTRLHLLLRLVERQAAAGLLQVVATTHSPQLLTSLSEESQKSAVLVYRLSKEASAEARRIVEIPGAAKVLKKQDLGKLMSTGWLEDAALFSSEEEAK